MARSYERIVEKGDRTGTRQIEGRERALHPENIVLWFSHGITFREKYLVMMLLLLLQVFHQQLLSLIILTNITIVMCESLLKVIQLPLIHKKCGY